MLNFSSIEAAWFALCNMCVKDGYLYAIDRGSFAGRQRRQLDGVGFRIDPGNSILTTFKGDYITTEDQIQQYFVKYLFSDEIQETEEYTYGKRIFQYMPTLIEMLRENPYTNQAVIEVGQPSDILLSDPPCLRVLSFKVVEGAVNLGCYFRSWDCFGGLPTNLGGLTMLNRLVASEAGLREGKLICFSDGLHVYMDHIKGYF